MPTCNGLRTTVPGTGIALAALSALVACSGEPAEPEPPPRPVDWIEVEPFDGRRTRRLVGYLRAVERAPISFEVPGRIATVEVDIGERFERGDLLAALDDRSYRLRLDERRAELAQAIAEQRETAADLERARRLAETGAASASELDGAIAAADTAAGRVDLAKASAGIAEKDLADTRLIAPYAGEVTRRLAEPSQQVAAGEPVLEIQGLAGLEVLVSVPETLVDKLTIGSRHDVRLPVRPELDLQARVTEIGAEATSRNAFPVSLRLSAAPSGLRAGMTAEVALTFSLERTDASGAQLVAIPVSAFLAGEGERRYAFLVDVEAGEVHRREIEVAAVDGSRALVSAGLAPGDIVVARGLAFLRDGQRVSRLGVGVERYRRIVAPGAASP